MTALNQFTCRFMKGFVLSLSGAEAPGQALKEERTTIAEEGGTTVVYNQNVSLSLEQQRQKLPVFKA